MKNFVAFLKMAVFRKSTLLGLICGSFGGCLASIGATFIFGDMSLGVNLLVSAIGGGVCTMTVFLLCPELFDYDA